MKTGLSWNNSWSRKVRECSERWGHLKDLLTAKAGTVCTQNNCDSHWITRKFQSVNVGERRRKSALSQHHRITAANEIH